MANDEPDWLSWARELQAIAQTGLTFSRDPYDRERYEALRALAAKMFAARTDAPVERIARLFAGETGYATPKIDVRAAVFDRARAAADGARDVGWRALDAAGRLGRREPHGGRKRGQGSAGGERLHGRVVKLAALWDRTRQRHPAGVFSCAKAFFVCEPTGGAATTSHETSEVGWFAEADLPQDLSLARVLPQQLNRMFAHRRDRTLPTDFD